MRIAATILFLIVGALQSEPIPLPNNLDPIAIAPYAEILVPRTILTFDQVLGGAEGGKFQGGYNAVPNFGYQPSGQAWVRFQLQPISEPMYLEFANAQANTVELFCQKGQGWDHETLGDMHSFELRRVSHRYPVFKIPAANQSRICYVAVKGTGSLYLPLTIYSPESFEKKSVLEYCIIGIYLGSMLILLAFTFFVYLHVRMKAYIYYCLWLLSVIVFNGTLNGLALQFSPIAGVWLANEGLLHIVTINSLLSILFGRAILESKKNFPAMDKWLLFLCVCLLGPSVAFSFVPSYAFAFGTWLWGIVAFSNLALAIRSLKRGIGPSKFFTIGWSVHMLGTMLNALWRNGLLGDIDNVPAFIQGLTLAEGLIFAFGLVRMRHAVLDMETRVRSLALKLLRVRERERELVAREIGEDFAQELSGVSLELNSSNIPHEYQDILSKTIERMRQISSDLRPSLIDHFGVGSALNAEANRMLRPDQFKHVMDITEESIFLPQKESLALIRIYQQILENVVAHSNATHVFTTLTKQGNWVKLHVRDNGRGIPSDKLLSPDSSGLLEMRIWAEEIGGKIEIDSAPGGGTLIIVSVPHTDKMVEVTPKE